MTDRLDWTIRKTAMWTAVLNNNPEVVLVARTKAKLMSEINRYVSLRNSSLLLRSL